MSSLKFPVIESKKNLPQQQDYNFVNKDKRKKTGTNNPIDLIDDLKKKIEQQKKQIENRNITIQGLQRNFQSLSVIVKNQKSQSALLRAQLENLKSNSQTGDRRASEYHEKCINLQKQIKNLKQQLKFLKKQHSNCGFLISDGQNARKQNQILQQMNEKLKKKITQYDNDKKNLQNELNCLKGGQKQIRQLRQRIVDLQQQVKNLTDINNALRYNEDVRCEQIKKLKSQISIKEKKIQQYKIKSKQTEKMKQKYEFQIQFLKKQSIKLSKLLQDTNLSINNKDLIYKLKEEQQSNLKYQLQRTNNKNKQLKIQIQKLLLQLQQKQKMINFLDKQFKLLKLKFDQLGQQHLLKQKQYKTQIDKLIISIGQLKGQLYYTNQNMNQLNKKYVEQKQKSSQFHMKTNSLHQDIDNISRQMQIHKQKYDKYIKLINQNQPDVVITNKFWINQLQSNLAEQISKLKYQNKNLKKQIQNMQQSIKAQSNNIENMKKYIKSLEDQVSSQSSQILQKNKLLRKYQDQQNQLQNMIQNQRKNSQKLKKQAQNELNLRLKQLQLQKNKNQKDIEQQKNKIQQQRLKLQHQLQYQKQRNKQQLQLTRRKAQQYNKLLQNYRRQQEQLKQTMLRQQQNILKRAKQRQQQIKNQIIQKQNELQKQKSNNKMLWTDNKKLKQLQKQLKQQSQKLLRQQQLARQQQLDILKRQLQMKYKDQLNSVKSEQSSNSSQLKRILLQRTNQFKQLSQDFNKIKNQSEFYKNRNKQLQGLISRIQKQYKDKMIDLQRQNKSSKQVIEVFDKKLKQSAQSMQEQQQKQRKQLKYLYDQIQSLKNKAKSQKIQQKVALIGKSMNDIQISLTALMNSMSCNYCVEVPKQCLRLQCGHIYCKKCKGGYQPNCGQCKKKSNPIPDKIVDNAVSKAQYMKLLITTVKQDIVKISL